MTVEEETAVETAPVEEVIAEAPADPYEDRLSAIEARMPAVEEEVVVVPPENLAAALVTSEPDHDADEFSDEEIQAWWEQNAAQFDEGADPQDPVDDVAELRQRLAVLEEDRDAQSAAQQDAELEALQDEYDDILEPEVLEPIRAKIQELVDVSGQEDLATNPKIVRMVYQAVKAEQLGADEVPAGSATLETAAGPSRQGEESLDEQYRNAIKGAGNSGVKSIFTR